MPRRSRSRRRYGGARARRLRGADQFFEELVGRFAAASGPSESAPRDEGVESFEDFFDGPAPAGRLRAESVGWSGPAESFEALFDGEDEPIPAETDPCPPPGPIPTRCTGLTVPVVLQCFGFDSATVLARHRPKIVLIARCVLASQSTPTPIRSLRVVGHTDPSGNAAYNVALGRRRAEAVKAAIESTVQSLSTNQSVFLSINVETRGRDEALSGDAALSRRVEVFAPFAFPLPCPASFRVSPSSATIQAGRSTTLRASDLTALPSGAASFTWRSSSTKLLLSGASGSPQVVSGDRLTVRARTVPTDPGDPPEVVSVTRTQSGCRPVTRQVRVRVDCRRFQLARPKIIAVATDGTITPVTHFTDPGVPGGRRLDFGQDLTFGRGRAHPHGVSVGSTTAVLDPKMRRLLSVFASGDRTGMARRLFNDFLAPQTAVRFWSDPDLNRAAAAHANIRTFVNRSISAPSFRERTVGRTRIHQALEQAGWDINAAVAPTDLGVPAFNLGSKVWSTGDFDNGLGLMINGVQHVIVVAKEYHYDVCRRQYRIKLEYILYDVFGLDDDDLREFGADGGIDTNASVGITAWWQLQHQHGYVPLITRISFERTFTISAP